LAFDYESQRIAASIERNALLLPDQKRAILRDRNAESSMAERLLQLGFRNDGDDAGDRGRFRITQPKLPRAIATLVSEGWRVEADGNLYRNPGEFQFDVRSGIDWFDLSGQIHFGELVVALPRLLEALRKGETTVQLSDGSVGVLSEELVGRYAMLAGIGKEVD